VRFALDIYEFELALAAMPSGDTREDNEMRDPTLVWLAGQAHRGRNDSIGSLAAMVKNGADPLDILSDPALRQVYRAARSEREASERSSGGSLRSGPVVSGECPGCGDATADGDPVFIDRSTGDAQRRRLHAACFRSIQLQQQGVEPEAARRMAGGTRTAKAPGLGD
jgi:hypothetical protein